MSTCPSTLAGNRVVLRVDDTGPGIPVDQRQLVLDRFHRGTEAPGGTGLGLAIADSVVRATDGIVDDRRRSGGWRPDGGVVAAGTHRSFPIGRKRSTRAPVGETIAASARSATSR